jgi:hypothetical protein
MDDRLEHRAWLCTDASGDGPFALGALVGTANGIGQVVMLSKKGQPAIAPAIWSFQE